MKGIGLVHPPKRRPNGITRVDREARKSDDLLKRDFSADKPVEKCVTGITELKAKDVEQWKPLKYRERIIEYRQAGHSLEAAHQIFNVS